MSMPSPSCKTLAKTKGATARPIVPSRRLRRAMVSAPVVQIEFSTTSSIASCSCFAKSSNVGADFALTSTGTNAVDERLPINCCASVCRPTSREKSATFIVNFLLLDLCVCVCVCVCVHAWVCMGETVSVCVRASECVCARAHSRTCLCEHVVVLGAKCWYEPGAQNCGVNGKQKR